MARLCVCVCVCEGGGVRARVHGLHELFYVYVQTDDAVHSSFIGSLAPRCPVPIDCVKDPLTNEAMDRRSAFPNNNMEAAIKDWKAYVTRESEMKMQTARGDVDSNTAHSTGT